MNEIEPIKIGESEHGVIRLFSVNLPDDELAAFNLRNGTWKLRDALGVDELRADHIALFPVSELEEMTLSDYLVEGQGIAPEQIDPLREELDRFHGNLLVLPSSALSPNIRELHIREPLKHIATLAEDAPPIIFERLPEVHIGKHPTTDSDIKMETGFPSKGASMIGAAVIAIIIVTILLIKQ